VFDRKFAIPLAAALTLLGAWSPQAPSGNGSTRGGPGMNDMNWTPPSYNLSTTNGPATSGAGGINRLGTTTNTNTLTPQCVKAQGAKLSQGTCTNKQRTVSYADGCGGTISKVEACTPGVWAYFYFRNAQGDGWMQTGSFYELKCVVPYTPTPATDCGKTAWPKQCLAGAHYGDDMKDVPQCPASWDVVLFEDGKSGFPAFYVPGGEIAE
jgi:hypothetical protein